MRIAFTILCLVFAANVSSASPVAKCSGSSDLDGSAITASVSQVNGVGEIFMVTSVDSASSPTKIESLPEGAFRIYNNSFQMDFTVSPTVTATPVAAFRGGEFFVDDFVCEIAK
jgi:hypothetical protein